MVGISEPDSLSTLISQEYGWLITFNNKLVLKAEAAWETERNANLWGWWEKATETELNVQRSSRLRTV